VANARALRVRDFSLRYVDEAGGSGPDGTWTGVVAATWRFAGFDRRPARAEIGVRFRREADRVALVAVGVRAGARPVPVWVTGPVTVRRTAATLVVDAGPGADRFARLARRAVSVVRRVLPGWTPRLVVEVPPAGRIDATLGARPGDYATIAAVTTSVGDASVPGGAPVHVFVNRDVLDTLRPAGAQVVVSHEATHVATGAAGSTMPLWLLEGFADYVALRDVRLPLAVTAARVRRQVARDGLPDRLPGAPDFDPGAAHLEAAYEAAWLACRTVAAERGERALLRFYRAVDAGTPQRRALARAAGLSWRELLGTWRDTLAHLPA
jgi:hypothetical protein